MAKPLSLKTRIIRKAIPVHQNLSNVELAQLLTGSDECKQNGIEVKPNDIAQQKQVMKKAGGAPAPAQVKAEEPANDLPPAKKRGRKPGAAPVARAKPAAAPAAGSPVDLIDGVLGLARQCGGVAELKRLVDKIAEMQG